MTTENPPTKIRDDDVDPAADVDLTDFDLPAGPPAITADDHPTEEISGPIVYLADEPEGAPPAGGEWLAAAAPPADDATGPPSPIKIDTRRPVRAAPVDGPAVEAVEAGDDELDELDGEQLYGEMRPGFDVRAVGIAAAVIVMLAVVYAAAGPVAEAFPPLAGWPGIAGLVSYTCAVCAIGVRLWRDEPVLAAWPGIGAVLVVCVAASVLVAAAAVHGLIALFTT